jgi:hypothetical protein
MIRTQVYLTKEQKIRLEQMATLENTSQATLLRELIDIGFHCRKNPNTSKADIRAPGTRSQPIDTSNKTATGNVTDLSTNLDHYLYGAPKKED